MNQSNDTATMNGLNGTADGLTRRERDDMAGLVRRRERVAKARVAAMEKSALAAIERASVETQTKLRAGGLTTDAARAFLDAMPEPADLLPALTVEQLAAALPTGERTTSRVRAALLCYGTWEPPALPGPSGADQ